MIADSSGPLTQVLLCYIRFLKNGVLSAAVGFAVFRLLGTYRIKTVTERWLVCIVILNAVTTLCL